MNIATPVAGLVSDYMSSSAGVPAAFNMIGEYWFPIVVMIGLFATIARRATSGR